MKNRVYIVLETLVVMLRFVELLDYSLPSDVDLLHLLPQPEGAKSLLYKGLFLFEEEALEELDLYDL